VTARWPASTDIPTRGWTNHGASWRYSSQVSLLLLEYANPKIP
jgi:hypothetical protein